MEDESLQAVDKVFSKQLFTARAADLLEAGDYKLVVKSRGGDAECIFKS